MSIALDAEQHQIVKDVLSEHLPPGFSVWVFGSRAKTSYRPYSDLDLAFKGDESLTLSQLADFQDAFSESDLPFKVDAADWRSASPHMQAVIDRDGVAL
jgi:predicted nucleotidyltransferase